jgi:DNA repair exonuclease SbcCD nuclease subunit
MFKFAALCIDRKIPYAAIFGNHDDEGDMSRQDLMDVLAELPYSVSKPGLKDIYGIGNYVVAVERPGYTSNVSLW